jgi:hypothetical protein
VSKLLIDFTDRSGENRTIERLTAQPAVECPNRKKKNKTRQTAAGSTLLHQKKKKKIDRGINRRRRDDDEGRDKDE